MIHAPFSERIRSAGSHRILYLLREADTDKMKLIGSLRRLLSQNALKDIKLSQPLQGSDATHRARALLIH